ncbi:MAG: hypothetical protein ABJN40_09690 [Sneathiella sp.]
MKRVGFVIGFTLLSAGQALADFQSGLAAYNNQNFAQAFDLWTAEASQGDVNSQFNLGLMFEKGVEGYPKDLSAAYAWYRLAASQGAVQAQQAIERIKPIMTAGQIAGGNQKAVETFGRWFRQNIGRDETEYKAAKEKLEADRKARIEVERQAAAARAQRQRDLIAQRNADAKLASQLEKESKVAAIKAAQEKAEEAKRRAFIDQRRREEEERLASLKAEQDKQKKLNEARTRLAELQAKQRGGAAPVQQPTVVAPTQPAPAAPQAPAQPVSAPAAQTVATPVVQATAPKKAPTPVVVSKPVQTPAIPVKKAEKLPPKPAPAAPQKKAVTQPVKAATSNVVEKKIEPATPIKTPQPKPKAVVASKPVEAPKTVMPVIENGLDTAVVKSIVATANSTPLDTEKAKAEISEGRTDIEALKWSLISAAKGKGSAKKRNDLLIQSMSPVQIAEANRRAAEWLSERQKRQ